MGGFIKHSGRVAPLDRADVDTDQIIPKQFLKRLERTGFGDHLFASWRQAGDFVLDREEYRGATVLVTGRNFGCGSSREHAAWALGDFGFQVIIAPSFADIFRSNADENGLVAIEISDDEVRSIIDRSTKNGGYQVTVDLTSRSLTDDQGLNVQFAMDDYRRKRLMEGLDRIELTLRHEALIRRHEAEHRPRPAPSNPPRQPAVQPVRE